MANLGYDVWLGNNRGNKYSRNHIDLNPNKDHHFWHFSLHEMGKYDLPAMIDFILKTTQNEKLTYIGHSQGTAQMFAAMTMNMQYYKQRINLFIALGPISNLANIDSGILKLLVSTPIIPALELLKIDELLQGWESIYLLDSLICKYTPSLCHLVLDLIADKDSSQNNDEDRFKVMIAKFPSGASLDSFKHFAKIIKSKAFVQLDGTPYNLDIIKDIPIALFVGTDDRLATLADNRILKKILENNNSLIYYKEWPDMGHSSYFISKTNDFAKDVVSIAQSYNES